jgi:hypothetical protein
MIRKTLPVSRRKTRTTDTGTPRRGLRWAWVPAMALSQWACSDPSFDHLQYRNVSSAPGTVNLKPREIQIEKGIAVRAAVSAVDDGGEGLSLSGLTSGDTRIFRVDPGPRAGEYVFSGVEVGTTELEVDSELGLSSLAVEVLKPE